MARPVVVGCRRQCVVHNARTVAGTAGCRSAPAGSVPSHRSQRGNPAGLRGNRLAVPVTAVPVDKALAGWPPRLRTNRYGSVFPAPGLGFAGNGPVAWPGGCTGGGGPPGGGQARPTAAPAARGFGPPLTSVPG